MKVKKQVYFGSDEAFREQLAQVEEWAEGAKDAQIVYAFGDRDTAIFVLSFVDEDTDANTVEFIRVFSTGSRYQLSVDQVQHYPPEFHKWKEEAK